ncbi:nucleotidyltransferase domain-containing protein [Candidatus Proelusimicrobium volucris]|uniref:nucleotidyltransferase domain-containing protein n=1 Tax=Candidatus Proelusimicrobium volucris TaxID=3416225 RepID=UPI003D0FCC63
MTSGCIIDIKEWSVVLLSKLKAAFGDRLLFLGYQGSYGRGEADENSDIDIVAVLEEVSLSDLGKYKELIKTMPHSDKACGFISGRAELANWSKREVFQLYFDTKPLYGDLKDIVPVPRKEDAKDAVKTGCEALYHACAHSFLYDSDFASSLSGIYKGIFFILQAEYYCNTGEYPRSKRELFGKLNGESKDLMQYCLDRKNFSFYSGDKLNRAASLLLSFCSDRIKAV